MRGLFRRRTLETEMNEELRAHLEALVGRNISAGMSREEARAAAQRTFGGVAQIQERARDERRSAWAENFFQDLRYAARALRKSPSFTITAVLTLALGVGMNAALFIVYNAVALRPLPVHEPDSLVTLRGRNEANGGHNDPHFSLADYLDYRTGNGVFSGLAAYSSNWRTLQWGEPAKLRPDPLVDAGDPGRVEVQQVSDNYFSVLGAELMLGRGFVPAEVRADGVQDVIVLSHRFWERRLHANPNVIGTALVLNRQPYTIVGVTAPEFIGHLPSPPAGWLPLSGKTGPRDRGALVLVGRLKTGVSVDQAKAELDVLTRRLAEAFPSRGRKTSVEMEPGMKWLHLPVNAQTLLVFAPVVLGFGMVLMIACANVANLLLARGVTRQQEIGVRLTLGASRGRIIRQLLVENLLLCGCGAFVGLLLALWFLQVLRPIVLSYVPPDWAGITHVWEALRFGPDHRVVLCTALLALAAGVAAGLAPALHASRANLLSALKDEGSAFGRRIGHGRLRNGLVISQVAVCLVLLSCAGLLVRNLVRVRALNLGFDARNVFLVGIRDARPPADVAARNAWLRETVETLRALPGVEGATLTRGGPLVGADTGRFRARSGDGLGGAPVELRFGGFTADFFHTFGVPMREGRTFSAEEVSAGAHVVVVSESTARRLWPGESAVGQTIAIHESSLTAFIAGGRETAGEGFVPFEVVGVAGDVRNGIWDDRLTFVYFPLPAAIANPSGVYVRPRDASPAALRALGEHAERAGLPLEFYQRLGTRFEEQMLPFLGLGWLSGALGLLALSLAAVGLYGVMAFAVNQRVREIGIRVALGAPAERIVRMFLRQGLGLVAIGTVIGLGGGALFAMVLPTLRFALGRPFDVVAFGASALLLGAVAMLACWLPARRATRVDPIVALRCE